MRCLSGGLLLPFPMLTCLLLADNSYILPPCRVLDTRTTNTLIQTNTPTTFGVGGMCGVPLGAFAVACDTLVPQGMFLNLAGFSGDLTTPTTSNAVSVGQNPSAPIAAFAVLPLSGDGQRVLSPQAYLHDQDIATVGETLRDMEDRARRSTPPAIWLP